MFNDRGIYNIEYVEGIKEAFIYAYTQEAYKHLKAIDMFNGVTTGNTISRNTLEQIIKNEK